MKLKLESLSTTKPSANRLVLQIFFPVTNSNSKVRVAMEFILRLDSDFIPKKTKKSKSRQSDFLSVWWDNFLKNGRIWKFSQTLIWMQIQNIQSDCWDFDFLAIFRDNVWIQPKDVYVNDTKINDSPFWIDSGKLNSNESRNGNEQVVTPFFVIQGYEIVMNKQILNNSKSQIYRDSMILTFFISRRQGLCYIVHKNSQKYETYIYLNFSGVFSMKIYCKLSISHNSCPLSGCTSNVKIIESLLWCTSGNTAGSTASKW